MSLGLLTALLAIAQPAAASSPQAEPTASGAPPSGSAELGPTTDTTFDSLEIDDEEKAEKAGYLEVTPGVLQAPWGYRTNYQWGLSTGVWIRERRSTATLGVFFGHVLGWKDSNIVRAGAQLQVGRLFAHDSIESALVVRFGYAGLFYGNRSHGGTVGFALRGNGNLGRRQRLVLGTATGIDLDFSTKFYVYPIITWRVTIGWRFRPKIVASYSSSRASIAGAPGASALAGS